MAPRSSPGGIKSCCSLCSDTSTRLVCSPPFSPPLFSPSSLSPVPLFCFSCVFVPFPRAVIPLPCACLHLRSCYVCTYVLGCENAPSKLRRLHYLLTRDTYRLLSAAAQWSCVYLIMLSDMHVVLSHRDAGWIKSCFVTRFLCLGVSVGQVVHWPGTATTAVSLSICLSEALLRRDERPVTSLETATVDSALRDSSYLRQPVLLCYVFPVFTRPHES